MADENYSDEVQEVQEVQEAEQTDSSRSREVPPLLRQAWETATGSGDPLEALGATRGLKAELPTWEAQLVKEAIADGATWETIGDPVGVSRQAAWDRFHHEVGELRRQRRREMEELRRRFREEAADLHHRYRDKLGTRRGRPRGRREE